MYTLPKDKPPFPSLSRGGLGPALSNLPSPRSSPARMDRSTSASSAESGSAGLAPSAHDYSVLQNGGPALLQQQQQQHLVAHSAPTPAFSSNAGPDSTAAGQAGGAHVCPTCQRAFATRRNLTRHAANREFGDESEGSRRARWVEDEVLRRSREGG